MKKQIEPFHIHPSHIQYSISVFMFNRKGTYKKGIQKYNKWNGFLFCDFQINGAFSAWSKIEQIFALQYIIHHLQLKTWCVYNLEIMCLYCIRTFTGYSPINYRNQCITNRCDLCIQWTRALYSIGITRTNALQIGVICVYNGHVFYTLLE